MPSKVGTPLNDEYGGRNLTTHSAQPQEIDKYFKFAKQHNMRL